VACCCVICCKDTDTDATEMDNHVVCSRRKSIRITAASVSCPKNFVRSGQNANKLVVLRTHSNRGMIRPFGHLKPHRATYGHPLPPRWCLAAWSDWPRGDPKNRSGQHPFRLFLIARSLTVTIFKLLIIFVLFGVSVTWHKFCFRH